MPNREAYLSVDRLALQIQDKAWFRGCGGDSRLIPDQVQHYFPSMRMNPVFEKVDALPGA